jgi:uncharacterized protein
VRGVIDTNVWVSALLNPTGPPAAVLRAFRDGRFTVVASEPLLDELTDVLLRPRIARRLRLTSEAVHGFVVELREGAVLVPVTSSLHLCRDPGDDMVIEAAAAGGATVLVSRDDDLKGDSELAQVLNAMGIEVLTVRRFLNRLDEEAV